MTLTAGASSKIALYAPRISLLLSMRVVYDPSTLSFSLEEQDEWDYKPFVHHAPSFQPSLHPRALFLSQRLSLAEELSLNENPALSL